MKRIVNTIALVGLAATATLTWLAARNARMQGARDINRWEDEGGKVVPEDANAGSAASSQPSAQS